MHKVWQPGWSWLGAAILLATTALAEPGPESAATPCLTTPQGIPLKVLVTHPRAAAFAHPDFTGERVRLSHYRRYYLFRKAPGACLVGTHPEADGIVGWVADSYVRPWHTRQCLIYVNEHDTQSRIAGIWPRREDVGKWSRPHVRLSLPPHGTSAPLAVLARDGKQACVALLWGVKPGHESAGENWPDISALQRDPAPRPLASVTEDDQERVNRPSAEDQEQGERLLAEGWCALEPGDGLRGVPAIHISRFELESIEVAFRRALVDWSDRDPRGQVEAFACVARLHVGPGIGVGRPCNLLALGDDLPFAPDALSAKWWRRWEQRRAQAPAEDSAAGTVEERLRRMDRKTRDQLRRGLNWTTLVVLLNDGAFSRHEEGWIPLELLPGTTL